MSDGNGQIILHEHVPAEFHQHVQTILTLECEELKHFALGVLLYWWKHVNFHYPEGAYVFASIELVDVEHIINDIFFISNNPKQLEYHHAWNSFIAMLFRRGGNHRNTSRMLNREL
jgi:hypothetical protein